MRKLIIGVAIGIVVVAVAVVLLRPRGPRPAGATLPDGTQVIVQAVTYGTNHNFVHGSKVLTKVRPFLPGFIGRLCPTPFTAMTIFREERLV